MLHRIPRRVRGESRRRSEEIQCAKLHELWRGLEAEHVASTARAIGLSNVCANCLQCLSKHKLRVMPAVIQEMHHLGMGLNPYGYPEWAARLGIWYMPYSVMGGVEGEFGAINALPEVRAIASSRGIGTAGVALQWIVQQRLPFTVLSNKASHLAANLQLFNQSWSLTQDEMAQLSALRKPPGRPSHWGDCEDVEAPGMEAPIFDDASAVCQGVEKPAKPGEPLSLKAVEALSLCVLAHCGGMDQVAQGNATDCWKLSNLRQALLEAIPHRSVSWVPLEATSLPNLLMQHPDPMGALQRGEIPAIIIRKFLPTDALNSMLRRLAIWADGLHKSRETALPFGMCPRGCGPVCELRELAYELPEPAIPCQKAYSSCYSCACAPSSTTLDRKCTNSSGRTLEHVEWPQTRLYGSFFEGGLEFLLNRSQAMNDRLRKLEFWCTQRGTVFHAYHKHWCSPWSAMLHGLRQLARGHGRRVAAASEPSGMQYVPGVLRIHRPSSRYPLHFDTHFMAAWTVFRSWVCDERPPAADRQFFLRRFDEQTLRHYAPLTHHMFSTAAILTLQAPARDRNPIDLRIFQSRWQTLIGDCRLKLANMYGVGGRLGEAGMRDFYAQSVPHVDIRGDPGDLYLFNSEHLHDLPSILGDRSRAVLGAVVGYSADPGDNMEVWS